MSKSCFVLVALFSSSLAALACSSSEGVDAREANIEPFGSLDLALVDGGVDGGQAGADAGADAAP